MDAFNEMFKSLGPYSGPLGWNLVLYTMFFLNLILLFVEGSSFGTNVSMVIMMLIFIDKTYAFGHMFNGNRGFDPVTCHGEVFFGTYLIRVAMFAGPLSIAGSTEKGAARGMGILTGLVGAIYMFGRWFTEQRQSKVSGVTCMVDPIETEVMLQTVGMMLILAQITLRNRFRFGTVDRYIPVTEAGELAAYELEK